MVDRAGAPVLGHGPYLSLILPHLVAGRDLADTMIDRLGDLRGQTVVVDARDTATGSPSFASQLVHRVLADGDADQLILVGAPARFAEQITDSANALGLAGRLDLTTVPPVAPVSTEH